MAFLIALATLIPASQAAVVVFRGKVVLDDGSSPGVRVPVERHCWGMDNRIETVTDKTGQFIWKAEIDPLNQISVARCSMTAVLKGYHSSSIDMTDPRFGTNPILPDLILTKAAEGPGLDLSEDTVPRSGQKAWDAGIKAMEERRWFDAERQMAATVKSAPKFSPGWSALGIALENQEKYEEARDAYQRAIAVDPKDPLPYYRVAHLQMASREWTQAAKTAETLIRMDTRRRFPAILVDAAVIRYHLGDLDGARSAIDEAIRIDKKHQLARAEYVLGMILEARQDYAAAGEHMNAYLRLDPKAADAAAVRERIANLGKPSSQKADAEMDLATPDLPVGEEVWVPGGLKAFAVIAHLTETPAYGDFFLEYCRQLQKENEPANAEAIPDYGATIQAYISSVAELSRMGTQRDDVLVVTMSLATDAERKKAEKILSLLGWKLSSREGSYAIEPGDQPQDVLRQPIPGALGIDEISMEETLVAGKSFSFEVTSDTARLENTAAWRDLMKTLPVMAGGAAELFARDLRLAKVYAGLGAMQPEAAAILLKSVGLRLLVSQHANVVALYAPSFAVSKGAVTLPGGADAHTVWQKLVGASPFDPTAFLRMLLEKDKGTLAGFYSAISRTDPAHQRFFTQSGERTERFYAWYRRSSEMAGGMERMAGTWRPALFRDLPLSASGHVRFPGGEEAWGASEADLPEVEPLDALVPLAQLEEKRKTPLDGDATRLLIKNYAEWRHLLPYFESLPGLSADDFRALAQFTELVTKAKPAVRNTLLGEWHSLVYLVVRGAKAGTLDEKRSAAAFHRICVDLTAPDYSARALAILREIVSGPATEASMDLDHAIPTRLLRLDGPHLDAFERARELQRSPRIDSLAKSPDPAKTAAALSGLVYAATLEPEHLLVSEDPKLLSKHRFVVEADGRGLPMFPRTELFPSSSEPGSYFSGGFTSIEKVASRLTRGGRKVEPVAGGATGQPATGAAPAPASANTAAAQGSDEGTVFRATGRLVEVYATIKDDKGHYVDDLPASDFTIKENGQPLTQVAFETRKSEVSVALLFDTTGSMQPALPALRNAALKLIGDLRPIDSVAVYSFNDSVTELQDFTTDKSAAKRAVMKTHAAGPTALYDALVRVNLDLAGRPGKKVIVVFTDGSDNCSVLTTEAAILRAKSAGIPIYTIAQGSALQHPDLLRQLATVSKTTGGVAFAIHNPSEIRAVFESVSEDLMHGYLVTFQPPPAEGHTWHPIEVTLQNMKGRKVRAREGYYPE